MNLGYKILELRKKAGLTQEELAEKVEVSRQTISNWELSETCPDIKQAHKLADLFCVSLDELTNNMLLTKISVTEKNYKKLFKIIFKICVFVVLIFFVEIVAISFYFLGSSKVDLEGSILLWCYTEKDAEEEIYVHYDNANNIIQLEGSDYIFDNIINKKEYKNAVELIHDITKHFEDNNGHCK